MGEEQIEKKIIFSYISISLLGHRKEKRYLMSVTKV